MSSRTDGVPTTPFMEMSSQTGALISIAALPFGVLFGELGGFERGMAAFIALSCIIASIRFAWPLRKERWFWLLMATVAVVHGLAVILLDWSWLYPLGKLGTLLVYPDFGVMIGLIYVTYRAIYGAPAKSVEDDPDEAPRYGQRNLEL